MPVQLFKSFKALKDEIRQELWPGATYGTSNEPENLVQAHDSYFLSGMSEIQRECEGLRAHQTNVISFEKTFFRQGLTIVGAPEGVTTRVYTIDLDWRQPVYYGQVHVADVEKMAMGHRDRRMHLVDHDDILPLGFTHADRKHDRRHGRARGGLFAIDPHDRNIKLAPWLNSNELLVVEWSGVKSASAWTDQDPISDSILVKDVLKLWVQYKHEFFFGDLNIAEKIHNSAYDGHFDIALADLILWDREQFRVRNTEAFRRQHHHGFGSDFGRDNFYDTVACLPGKCQPRPYTLPEGARDFDSDDNSGVAVAPPVTQTPQVYEGAYADPNAEGLIPNQPGQGALYIQLPAITLYNMWTWDVPSKTWVQIVEP